MVMAQSLIIGLKERNPDVPVDVIAPAWSLPVAHRMEQVREAIALPTTRRELAWAKRRAMGKALRDRAYSQAFVLPRSLKSVLVPWFAGVPRRTGYRGEWRYGLLNDLREADPARSVTPARRWLALAYPPTADLPAITPLPRLRPDPANQHRLLQALGLDIEKPVVVLAPGAEHGAAKRWPAEHFARLARTLSQQDMAVWLLGSPKEASLARDIAAGGGPGVSNLCGRTRLVDAIDLLGLARGVVSNDSGLMHVAAAVGAFVLALYGPSTPAFCPPLTDNRRVLYLNLECSPCFAHQCPLGHHDCMRKIMPDAVADALLAKTAQPGLMSLPASQATDGSVSYSST
jgi:heptosyltransferase-2